MHDKPNSPRSGPLAMWVFPLRALLAAIVLAVVTSGAARAADGAQRLDGPGLEVAHPAGLEGAAARVVAAWPRLREAAEKKLGVPYPRTAHVRLVRDHGAFQDALREFGTRGRPGHVAAVAFPFADLIVMRVDTWHAEPGGMEALLQHEMVHCILGHLQRTNPDCRIPTWLDEGLAQWVPEQVHWGRDLEVGQAAAGDALLALDDLVDGFPDDERESRLAYAQSLGLVRHIETLGFERGLGGRAVPDLVRLLGHGFGVDEALRTVLGLDLRQVEASWRREAAIHGVPLQSWPEFVFAALVLTTTALIFARVRLRRARMIARLEREDALADARPPVED